jgi:hypothetical protein
MSVAITVEQTDTGFVARALGYPVSASGRNLKVLQANMLKELNNYFKDAGIILMAADLRFKLSDDHTVGRSEQIT